MNGAEFRGDAILIGRQYKIHIIIHLYNLSPARFPSGNVFMHQLRGKRAVKGWNGAHLAIAGAMIVRH